jgi:hypothetical protein
MTIARNPKLCVPFWLLLSALILLCAVAARGAPSIEVQIGFNGHVVPERYAPLRLRIRGYDGGESARVVVTQRLGNEWRDTATVRQELEFAVTSDGSYTSTVPIYEPLNPIEVALVDEIGRTVAETALDLQLTRHLETFPLLYGGLPFAVAEDPVPVTAAELPASWWAYDSVRSLWLSSPPPREAWTAIAQWVLSGGSVVIVAGPDYFRFDSPGLRSILPIANPVIETGPDGVLHLVGTLREGANVSVARGGLPILLERTYGAGHVCLVAVRATELTEAEFAQIIGAVPASARISFSAVSEALLGDLPVVRPTHLSALLLIAISCVGLAGAAVLGRRRRLAGWLAAGVVFASLSVWSGFHANSTNDVSYLYSMNTSFQLIATFGIRIDSYSFYSSDPRQREHAIGSEAIPVQAPPALLPEHPLYAFMPQPTATPWIYAHTAKSGHVTTSAVGVRQKTFYAFAGCPSLLHLAVDSAAGRAVLTNQAADRLADCWLLVDGRGTTIPSIPRGTSTYSIRAEQTLAALVSETEEPAALVLQHLAEELPLHQGVWFVGLSPLLDLSTQIAGQKVRHLDVYVVRGEVS